MLHENLSGSGFAESSAVIDVAAAVILKPNGCFLLGQRPPGKPYSGFWEFPGGKIEAGETALRALYRELDEELDIRVASATPWLTQVYRYAHATVRLRFFRVSKWDGEIIAREHAALAWQSASDITVAPLLPANRTVLRALRLPDVYAITPDSEKRPADYFIKLGRALRNGLRLLQVRDKNATGETLAAFARETVVLCQRHKAQVLLNADISLAEKLQVGVHLTAAQLHTFTSRPPLEICGASCHNVEELELAACLGVDFVVLGSIRPTATHTHSGSLGWRQFTELIADYPLPVFAIGGMRTGDDLRLAKSCGAHGIAMIRGAWQSEDGLFPFD